MFHAFREGRGIRNVPKDSKSLFDCNSLVDMGRVERMAIDECEVVGGPVVYFSLKSMCRVPITAFKCSYIRENYRVWQNLCGELESKPERIQTRVEAVK